MGEDHDGGYSEWVRVPADWAVPIPDGIDELPDALDHFLAGEVRGRIVVRILSGEPAS